jgi:hypothetical protein
MPKKKIEELDAIIPAETDESPEETTLLASNDPNQPDADDALTDNSDVSNDDGTPDDADYSGSSEDPAIPDSSGDTDVNEVQPGLPAELNIDGMTPELLEQEVDVADDADTLSIPATDPDTVDADDGIIPAVTIAGLAVVPDAGDTKPLKTDTLPKQKRERVRKKSIFDLDLNQLDRFLTPEEQQEWSSIYASYRAKSILTGTVIGTDEHTFDVRNRTSGKIESKTLTSLIIVNYRVKVLIPESELWMPGDERPDHIVRSLTGSTIDYVIIEVDREGQCAIGSRRVALAAKRHFFATARGGHQEGELLKCRVLVTGARRCTVEIGGYDLQLTQRDLSYTSIPDLRERFHPGQELSCRLKAYDSETGMLSISVRESAPNPFIGADMRHPVGSRRQAKISGKYAGGVFCTLSDGTVCLCIYSIRHSDFAFSLGDNVIIVIESYNYERMQIYGQILSKWHL